MISQCLAAIFKIMWLAISYKYAFYFTFACFTFENCIFAFMLKMVSEFSHTTKFLGTGALSMRAL